MELSQQIEAVYQRAVLLRLRATESPVQPDLLETALKELYFVLEELQTSEEELRRQNRELTAARQQVGLERQRYQTLFELAPDGYLVTDRQGKIFQANQAAAALFLVPQVYLVNKPLVLLIDEADRSYFLQQLAHPERVQDWEVTLKHQGSSVISVAITVRQVENRPDHPPLLLWSLHEISQRKQMEQLLRVAHNSLERRVEERTAELAQANARLQQEIDDRIRAEQTIRSQAALIDVATDAIYVQDAQACIVFWNQGAERLYGWTADEVLGKPAHDLFEPRLSPESQARLNLEAGISPWQGELEHQTKAGKPLTVFSRQTLMSNGSGQSQVRLVVNTNIPGEKPGNSD